PRALPPGARWQGDLAGPDRRSLVELQAFDNVSVLGGPGGASSATVPLPPPAGTQFPRRDRPGDARQRPPAPVGADDRLPDRPAAGLLTGGRRELQRYGVAQKRGVR